MNNKMKYYSLMDGYKSIKLEETHTEWITREVMLLVYEPGEETDILCKIKLKPRTFQKLFMKNVNSVRIYYWSPELGGHLIAPIWKEKAGVFTLDLIACVEKIQILAKEEGNGSITKEMEACMNSINQGRQSGAKYCVGSQGAVCIRESGGDWSQTYFDFYFAKESFSIEGTYIDVMSIHTCDDKELFDSELFTAIEGASWNKEQLYAVIKAMDSYDSYLSVVYEKDGKEQKEVLRLDGHRSKRIAEFFGLKSRIEADYPPVG